MWNGVFIWNFYWAACGAQFWNGLSLFKNDKMADGSPWRRCVSHSHFNGPISAGRGRVISGRLANKFGSRFGTNTKLLPGVIGPISAPSDYLSTVFDDVILACAGAAETMPPSPPDGPHGKTFNLYRLLRFSPCVCKVLPEYAICTSNRNIFTCHG